MAITAKLAGPAALSATLSEKKSLSASLPGSRVFIPGTTMWLTEVTLLASAWEGEKSPYSQVVSIDGITEYSKVDLQPSVEQLTIFHQKDLAFVTENEDGVVTVFAIGDKPSNDYTMQATVSEVKA